MDPQLFRSLRHVSATRRHRRDDVLAFERLDCLLQRDSVADQLANDRIQTVIDTHHFGFNLDECWEESGDSTPEISAVTKKIFDAAIA